jgi:hypothetical protein
LQGLGAMATMGETTCLLAAVVITPAALVMAGRRGHQSGGGDLAEPAEPRRHIVG